MILLMAFAFLAGAATALSPCALPVLPVVFSAGVTGGRRRPLGVATGLALSFTFAVVALVYVISALGLPDELLRGIAIAVLLVFGLTLIVPGAAARVEAWISRVTSRGAGRVAASTSGAAEGDGFWSGAIVGAGLGFVYAPCAGPILAGVITATASQSFSGERLAIALAYGLGSALTFYALMIGGRRLISPFARRSAALQAAMGVAMVLVALAMAADLDTRFQTTIADKLPSWVVNPTGSLERSESVSDDLARARAGGPGGGGKPRPMADTRSDSGAEGSGLPDLGAAPEIIGTQQWFNTPGGKRLTIAGQRGKVVLVDFWTYTCINCIRTLPFLKSWYSKYRDDGLKIIGVHTPEFPFERSAGNVADAIEQNKLRYPAAQDNDYKTWTAFQNEFWPAKYLIDAEGHLRYFHFGEGDYDETEDAIRALLAEAGRQPRDESQSGVKAETASGGVLTPESYLGYARAAAFTNGSIDPGTRDYGAATGALPDDHLRFAGRWRVDASSASARRDARLDLRFRARRVFLVLGAGKAKRVRIRLDGRPVTAADSGEDLRDSVVTVRGQRLYRLIDMPSVGTHTLTVLPDRGVSAYAFTFG